MIFASAAWDFTYGAIRVIFYLAAGVLFFGAEPDELGPLALGTAVLGLLPLGLGVALFREPLGHLGWVGIGGVIAFVLGSLMLFDGPIPAMRVSFGVVFPTALVIASLTGASLALVVVEPTASGLHDFHRVAELMVHPYILDLDPLEMYAKNQNLHRPFLEKCRNEYHLLSGGPLFKRYELISFGDLE